MSVCISINAVQFDTILPHAMQVHAAFYSLFPPCLFVCLFVYFPLVYMCVGGACVIEAVPSLSGVCHRYTMSH